MGKRANESIAEDLWHLMAFAQQCLKGYFTPTPSKKNTKLSSFTHAHVLPNLYDYLFFWNPK